MKYKLHYKNTYQTIHMGIISYIGSLSIDVLVTLAVDIIAIFSIYFVLYAINKGVDNIDITIEQFLQALKVTSIAEAIIILLVNIKKQFIYCEFRHNGLFLYTNNDLATGYRRKFSRNSLIPYSEIVSVKKTVNHNVPETYSAGYRFNSALLFVKRKMNIEAENQIVPAIAFGDFSGECIAVELKNHKTLYLPIRECDKFIEEYKKLKNIIDESAKGYRL